MELDRPLLDYDYVAFDTETTGAWPVGCDIVEFGAVRWSKGVEVGQMQMLFKPRMPMTDFIIGIHGITNEMVADAPPISTAIKDIAEFFRGAVAVAHHAPFDLGFVAIDFENNQVPFPTEPVLCTSLLARKLIHSVPNHKLQTLVKHLGVDGGSAHRAFDDARSCLHVAMACFAALGPEATLRKAIQVQGKDLRWDDYAVMNSEDHVVQAVVAALRDHARLEFIYDKGTSPRQVLPQGLVRNPDGDFIQALCLKDQIMKRFYLSKVREAVVIPASAIPSE